MSSRETASNRNRVAHRGHDGQATAGYPIPPEPVRQARNQVHCLAAAPTDSSGNQQLAGEQEPAVSDLGNDSKERMRQPIRCRSAGVDGNMSGYFSPSLSQLCGEAARLSIRL